MERDSLVPSWIADILPYEWRSDLEELRRELLAQERSRLVVALITLRSFLEMGFAGLWIKWDDLILPESKNISREVVTDVQHGDIADVQHDDLIYVAGHVRKFEGREIRVRPYYRRVPRYR